MLLLANIFWTSPTTPNTRWWIATDDRKIGIQTSAILFGRFDVAAVMLCYASFWRHGMDRLVAACSRGPTTRDWRAQLALGGYQYSLIRDRDPQRCFRAFRDNNWVGAVIFAGIALAYLLPDASDVASGRRAP